MPRFKAKLWRVEGPGGWHFASVPKKYAPPATHGWGRTPVHARVDGKGFDTSVWRDKKHGTLLAVSKRMRGDKVEGDVVEIELLPR